MIRYILQDIEVLSDRTIYRQVVVEFEEDEQSDEVVQETSEDYFVDPSRWIETNFRVLNDKS